MKSKGLLVAAFILMLMGVVLSMMPQSTEARPVGSFQEGVFSVDFPSVAARSINSSVVNVPGATAPATVKVSYPPNAPLGILIWGRVIDADQVTLVVFNGTAGAINPPALDYYIKVEMPNQ